MYRESRNRKIDGDTKSKHWIGKQRCENQNKVKEKTGFAGRESLEPGRQYGGFNHK